MTDHILNFAISIDDDTIIKNIQEKAEKSIINDIKIDVMNCIFDSKYYGDKAVNINRYNGKVELANGATLSRNAEEIVRYALKEWKDEIIDMASDKLVKSLTKSTKWKDKVEVIFNETDNQ